MNINLIELEHQAEALDKIIEEMEHFHKPVVSEDNDVYANPLIENSGVENTFIDVKMETGTGKTYVYTRTMYELHKRYGLYKFIIVVPSLAIKEGTKNFISSDYAKQHFSTFYPNIRMNLHLINKGDFSTQKGKRKSIAPSLIQFCEASQNDKNSIQCMLISDIGFLNRDDSALFKDDYDQTLYGGYCCPIDGLAASKPVVIIDEPHRFSVNGSTYQNIINRIKPQLIIRFGATFPMIREGRGRNRIERPQYYGNGPVYDLNAVRAFNEDLVKDVYVQFPDVQDCTEANKYKVVRVTDTQLELKQGNRRWTLEIDEDLSKVNDGRSFEGSVRYDGCKKLSNGLELRAGMDIIDVSDNSYQEILIQQAIDKHFECEVENFCRQGYKVKTNALFFIDDIKSYRNSDGWLKTIFERVLKEKITSLLQEYTEGEYHDFLMASLKNISLCHGGYFAGDTSSGNDWGAEDPTATAEEVADVLHKERTLPFKKPNGDWNIRRFFFSKWTLREGWDNPNVFTICKLRSSGSETSKIQEVGRGLRLPVDEQGNRLAQSWKLNYIVGWDERDFAQKLRNDINSQATVKLDNEKLTDTMIKLICDNRNITDLELFKILDDENIINRLNDFEQGGYEKLLNMYPELLSTQLKSEKVTTKKEKKTVKLRKKNWGEIKELWKEISKRYMLSLEQLESGTVEKLIEEVLSNSDVFDANKEISIEVSKIVKGIDANSLQIETSYETVVNNTSYGKMEYASFIKEISKRTYIPVQILHKQVWERLKKFAEAGKPKEDINSMLNSHTLNKICKAWDVKFAEKFATRYDYNPLDYNINTSVFDTESDDFKDEIDLSILGGTIATDIGDDVRNLYEKPIAFDSEIEHKVEQIVPDKGKFVVYGKIPRRAIMVPKYTGGTTSPDFIFVSNRKTTLLVETKSEDKRESEKISIEAQRKFFEKLPNVQYKEITEVTDLEYILSNL